MLNRHPRLLIGLALVTCCLAVVAAFGQSGTATLSGTVVDPNGAVVPGAEITILNSATTLKRQTTTGDEGNFTVSILPPGTYSVAARREGFSPLEIQNIALNVGDQKALRIELKAGDVNATVQVTSQADLVRTDAAVGTVVDRQFAANIPLNGRSFQSLIALTPGVVVVPAAIGGAATNSTGQFSV